MNRILIAEDEQRIASFLQKGLRSNGFTPTVVEDGAAALDYALTGDFDLMVLDIGLPVMDGFAVLRRLRGAGSALPVIILTARDSVSDTVAGLEGGALTTTWPSPSGSRSCWRGCGCACATPVSRRRPCSATAGSRST